MKIVMTKFSNYVNRAERKTVWAVTIAIGTLARVLIAERGHNGDFQSWIWCVTVMRDGVSVYSGSANYGFGPIWMFVLKFADMAQGIFPDNRQVFRLVIILILTAFDLAIAILIAKKFSRLAGLLFFINPVSIIISGFHNQFDNFAIFISLSGILLLDSIKLDEKKKSWWLGLALIGLSLAVKHILLFFPIWLFFRAGTFRQRISRMIFPYSVYLVCFIPWLTSINQIKIIVEENYFKKGGELAALLTLFGTDAEWRISGFIDGELVRKIVYVIWLTGVLVFGWIMRNRSLVHSLLIYLVVMVGLAPEYSQQQLILPLLAVFIYATRELKIFYLITLIFMIQNKNELGIGFFFPNFFRVDGTIYGWLQVLLIIFSLRMIFKDHPSNLKSKNLQAALKIN